ncbi:hypothetical protein H072_10632 [Dactylellina haptotyla CBS 200.50]|uniref:Alpha/beta hydrolase fold-3 domain-containing protein n=1 Tax=Dactylellina haptotyla (strain CBS 200.50) TaxID=1284197 RepID=S7ZYU1_DACHA|nr:hypothetical protein H072_10632 [Dactylellina haptotyla CBS 200.50]
MRSKTTLTQDGTVAITHSSSYSLRSRLLYSVLRVLYPTAISWLLSKPSESGHQPINIPKSIYKHFVVQKREFYDWSVYDISLKPKEAESKDGHGKSEVKRRMLYIPGTGFVMSTSSEHFRFVTTAFVEGVQAVVTVVLHPLAPKNTVLEVYPKVFELYEQLAASLPPDGEMDIGGDSSGGGISLSVTQHLRERGLRLPDRLFMMAPSVDFVQPQEEDMKIVSKLDPLQKVSESHDTHLKWVNNSMPLDDPIVSPIRGIFGDIQGVKVIGLVGKYDILDPDCTRLVERLKKENITTDWLFGEKMVHCWPLMHVYKIPEAKDAIVWIIDKMK